MAAKAAAKKRQVRRRLSGKKPVKKASGEGAPTAAPSGDHLDDTPMRLSVEAGKSSIMLDEALQIGEQSLIELGKEEGDSVDVLLNGRLARSGAVTVGAHFGVRTQIVSEV